MFANVTIEFFCASYILLPCLHSSGLSAQSKFEIVQVSLGRGLLYGITFKRDISNAELSTVLRPFYFAVHPDLFGRHPEQRTTNEESLKHLSEYLESLQKHRSLTSSPKYLMFYIRDAESRDTFKLVKIELGRHLDVRVFIKNILSSCSLPTDKIEKLKITSQLPNGRFSSEDDIYTQAASIFEQYEMHYRNIQKAKQEKTLQKWIDGNIKTAIERSQALDTIRDEVQKFELTLKTNLKLSGIEYDCAWNIEHIRGCLKSLDRLSKMHGNVMRTLEGRTIVLAQTSGVSLEGHVMLFTGDVQHNWLDFIRNISKQDAYLKQIPAYEQALSQVMRGIQVARRKFMPKAQVVNYAAYLCKVTTTMLDYLTPHSSYPKIWPDDLSNFEIVVESESGPLMVSPTGQFITPATCPGVILVDFLTNHMEEATEKSRTYKKNKHIERDLHAQCQEKLKLKLLTKDDSIDPIKMINSLERLVNSNIQMHNCVLHITHYYSVLSDGTVCIPWDWTP